MTAATVWRNKRDLDKVAAPPGHEQAVLAAASAGPMPTDPQIRAAAHRLAVHRLERDRSGRPAFIACAVVFTALSLLSAVLESPRSAALAVVWVVLVVYVGWVLPRRQERRIALLDPDRDNTVAPPRH